MVLCCILSYLEHEEPTHGIKINGEVVNSTPYADDIVLIVDTIVGLQQIINLVINTCP